MARVSQCLAARQGCETLVFLARRQQVLAYEESSSLANLLLPLRLASVESTHLGMATSEPVCLPC
jgi:hypothetical protein